MSPIDPFRVHAPFLCYVNDLAHITLQDYYRLLQRAGCKMIRTHGSHEVWSRSDLSRPIIVRSDLSPVPPFIIDHALRQLHLDRALLPRLLAD